MGKSTRFFWIYTIVLFAVAFALILLSSLTASRHQEELSKNLQVYKGAQNSVIALTEENEALKATLLAKDEEIAAIQNELSALHHEISEREAAVLRLRESTDSLINAENEYRQGKYRQSLNTLSGVDRGLLGEKAAERFDSLSEQLKGKI